MVLLLLEGVFRRLWSLSRSPVITHCEFRQSISRGNGRVHLLFETESNLVKVNGLHAYRKGDIERAISKGHIERAYRKCTLTAQSRHIWLEKRFNTNTVLRQVEAMQKHAPYKRARPVSSATE